MEIINGFDLFETRHYLDENEHTAIELKYEYKIPPILKTFYSTFKWKQVEYDHLTFYFCPSLKYGNIEFHVKSLEDMIKVSLNSNDDDIVANKLLSLASGFKNIFVGTIGELADKIVLDDSGDFIVIAENIFSFFLGVTTNLVQTARSKEEYMHFMEQLGYEGEELLREGEDWIKYNRSL